MQCQSRNNSAAILAVCCFVCLTFLVIFGASAQPMEQDDGPARSDPDAGDLFEPGPLIEPPPAIDANLETMKPGETRQIPAHAQAQQKAFVLHIEKPGMLTVLVDCQVHNDLEVIEPEGQKLTPVMGQGQTHIDIERQNDPALQAHIGPRSLMFAVDEPGAYVIRLSLNDATEAVTTVGVSTIEMPGLGLDEAVDLNAPAFADPQDAVWPEDAAALQLGRWTLGPDDAEGLVSDFEFSPERDGLYSVMLRPEVGVDTLLQVFEVVGQGVTRRLLIESDSDPFNEPGLESATFAVKAGLSYRVRVLKYEIGDTRIRLYLMRHPDAILPEQ